MCNYHKKILTLINGSDFVVPNLQITPPPREDSFDEVFPMSCFSLLMEEDDHRNDSKFLWDDDGDLENKPIESGRLKLLVFLM